MEIYAWSLLRKELSKTFEIWEKIKNPHCPCSPFIGYLNYIFLTCPTPLEINPLIEIFHNVFLLFSDYIFNILGRISAAIHDHNYLPVHF